MGISKTLRNAEIKTPNLQTENVIQCCQVRAIVHITKLDERGAIAE
jgi:hypothetical protein